jgi:hypothetical protein
MRGIIMLATLLGANVLTARGLAHAPCTPAGICTDAHGDPWGLGPIGNEQIVDGPSDPTYTYKYAFSLYQNLDPVPPVCRGFSIFGTNSARYDDSRFGTCEQLGPDMNLAAPRAYQFSAKDEGLTFVYRYAGSQLTVNLECSFGHAERCDRHGSELQRGVEDELRMQGRGGERRERGRRDAAGDGGA